MGLRVSVRGRGSVRERGRVSVIVRIRGLGLELG